MAEKGGKKGWGVMAQGSPDGVPEEETPMPLFDVSRTTSTPPRIESPRLGFALTANVWALDTGASTHIRDADGGGEFSTRRLPRKMI